MSPNKEQIIKKILGRGNLPSLSLLAFQLLNTASREDVTAAELAAIIEKDPGMAGRLLRVANSPVYRRGPVEITNLQRAVVQLGLREVLVLALSLSLKDTLKVNKGGPDYHLYWRTSLHRAVLARIMAKESAFINPEDAFVAGLLQELGLPLLLEALPPEEHDGFPGFHWSLDSQLEWARRKFGVDHREIAAVVMAEWGLPPSLVECQALVGREHEPDTPRLTLLADLARRAAESFFAPGVELDEIYLLAAKRLGLPEDGVNQILMDSLGMVGDTAEALEVTIPPEELMALGERVRQALERLRGC